MRCPYCRSEETKVVDSRPSTDGQEIRRRRLCEKCEARFTTYERAEVEPLRVIKKDGTQETYRREKLVAGLLRACEKRPVGRERIEAIADAVEGDLRAAGDLEIPYSRIGETVLRHLAALDTVAYVRFASVYQEFDDVEAFRRILAEIGTAVGPAPREEVT